MDWTQTRAYGLGINGLYLNLRERERDGIVDPGRSETELLDELATRLEAVRDDDGRRVIRRVYRADKVYSGNATAWRPTWSSATIAAIGHRGPPASAG